LNWQFSCRCWRRWPLISHQLTLAGDAMTDSPREHDLRTETGVCPCDFDQQFPQRYWEAHSAADGSSALGIPCPRCPIGIVRRFPDRKGMKLYCSSCGVIETPGSTGQQPAQPLDVSHLPMGDPHPIDLVRAGRDPVTGQPAQPDYKCACLEFWDSHHPECPTGLGRIAASSEPAQPHPEEKCQQCDRQNVVWSAPNDLWNSVMGSPNGIVCPTCFIVMAAAAGIDRVWRVEPQPAQPGSELVRNLRMWGRPDETDHDDADTRVRRALCEEAASALTAAQQRIAALESELSNERARNIHTCHDQCERPLCVAGRRIRELERENADLRCRALPILPEQDGDLPEMP
jgi:hypothetical protein